MVVNYSNSHLHSLMGKREKAVGREFYKRWS